MAIGEANAHINNNCIHKPRDRVKSLTDMTAKAASTQPTRRTSWKLVANPGWQSGFPTSFQLVRLVGCGLNSLLYG